MIRDGFASTASEFGYRGAALLPPDFWLKRENSDPVTFSRIVSSEMDRPILVVSLDLVSDATGTSHTVNSFTGKELATRADYFKTLALNALPDARDTLWKDWNWNYSANMHAPNSDYMVSTKKPGDAQSVIAPRLEGNCWVTGGIIILHDRRMSNTTLWASISGVPADKIEHVPQGEGVRDYIFLHELHHAAQRKTSTRVLDRRETPDSPDFVPAWHIERDADQGAIDAMLSVTRAGLVSAERAEDLRETVTAVIHSRALNGFLSLAPHYWFAPSLATDNETSIALNDTAPKQNWLSMLELRLRVHAELTNMAIPRDSASIQTMLTDWRAGLLTDQTMRRDLDNLFGAPFKWADHSLENIVPALRFIVANGDISDPFTRQQAAMVIEAAEYFRPSLRLAPQLNLAHTAANSSGFFPYPPSGYGAPRVVHTALTL